jgi:DNA replication protein
MMGDQGAGHNAPLGIVVPVSFVDELLPKIRDVAEIKVLLTLYRLVAEPDWSEGVVPEALLYADERLLAGLRLAGASRPPVEDIRRGIELAVARGALLRVRVTRGDDVEFWLMFATPDNRSRVSLLQRGLRSIPQLITDQPAVTTIEPERPNVFRLYEQNIGLVTPIIADQLIEALELYPREWIEDAIREAVDYNRRQWRYIQRILERWVTEGRGNETDRRRGRSPGSFDPEKHLRGKHAALFRRRG